MIDAGALNDLLVSNGLPVSSIGVCRAQDTATWPSAGWYFRADVSLWVRVDWSATPTAQQQTTAGTLIAGFSATPTVAQLLAQMQQVELTLAAIVEALVTAKGNNAAVFNGLQTWATNQITTAHNWIKSQGG